LEEKKKMTSTFIPAHAGFYLLSIRMQGRAPRSIQMVKEATSVSSIITVCQPLTLLLRPADEIGVVTAVLHPSGVVTEGVSQFKNIDSWATDIAQRWSATAKRAA
jgi:hypothetical protein